jgi:Cu/Ag efflux protein CusF
VLEREGNSVFRSTSSFRAARALALAAAVCGLSLPAACASRPAASTAAQAPRATHRGAGVVVAVNAEKGRVKINHEKIEGYMDPMTMWFEVKDPKMLEGLAPNDRVEFVITEEESADVLTEIRKV